jgi:hypothetical protein
MSDEDELRAAVQRRADALASGKPEALEALRDRAGKTSSIRPHSRWLTGAQMTLRK